MEGNKERTFKGDMPPQPKFVEDELQATAKPTAPLQPENVRKIASKEDEATIDYKNTKTKDLRAPMQARGI